MIVNKIIHSLTKLLNLVGIDRYKPVYSLLIAKLKTIGETLLDLREAKDLEI